MVTVAELIADAPEDPDGPLCVCGHFLTEHHPRGLCFGKVGDDDCTCLGHRETKRSRR